MKSKEMRLAGQVARIGLERKLSKVFVGKTERKRPPRRSRRRWEDGIRMSVKDIGWEDIEWVQFGSE
jgi:hypothetical protein